MVDDDALLSEQLRGRATAAVRAVVIRGLGIRGLTFLGQVLLARMLVPEDFGVMILGLALFNLTTFLAEGGLGAALIRRTEPPTREEFQNLLGIQLAASLCVLSVAIPLLHAFTSHGAILAAMMASVPIICFQAAGTIHLERSLNFRPKVTVEILEAAIYTISALALTVGGAGLWAFPIAAGARVTIGTSTMLLLVPEGRLLPRLRISKVRSLLRFGIHFQLIGVMNVVRDQGNVAAITILSSLATVGQWGLGYRFMQPPFILLESIWRVSYPVMSQIVQTGGRPDRVVGRLIVYTGAGLGLLLVPLAATADLLIPLIVGGGWEPAASVVIPASVGLLIGGPISAAGAGYLYACGDSVVMLRASAIHTLVWITTTILLVGQLGVAAAGLGWMLAGIIDAVVIGQALWRRGNIRAISTLLPLWICAALAVGIGYWVSHLNETLPPLFVGLLVGEAIFVSAMMACYPGLARSLVRSLRR